jgi:hypothetical protein
MKRGWRTAALVAALVAAPATAHEEGDRAMGVVEDVTAKQLVLKATDGHSMAIAITGETRFVRGEKPVTAEDVQIGERAVVQVERTGEAVRAIRVKLGAAPARK